MLKPSLFLLVTLAALHSCSNDKPVQRITAAIEVDAEADKVKEVLIPEVGPEPNPKELEPEVVQKPTEASTMEKWLKGGVVYQENGQVVQKDITKGPRFYVMYITAEWSNACKGNVSHLKKIYKNDWQVSKDVELVMVSSDDAKWVMKWAGEEQLEWPVLLGDAIKKIPNLYDLSQRYVGYYLLFDKDGKQYQTVNLEDCIGKLKELRGE